MLQASHQAIRPNFAAGFLALLIGGAARALARIQERRSEAHTRRMLSTLTDAQLMDIGVDRSAIDPARPIIEVKAGLMARLMSMR